VRNGLRSDRLNLCVLGLHVKGFCVIDYAVAQDGTKGVEKMPPKSKRVLPGKRYPLNMRTTKELRDKIEEAATASGRSLVQEVEFRLEKSFQEDAAYGGPHLSAVFRLLVDHKALIEAKAGVGWKESDRVRDEIAQVLADLFAKELPRFHSVTIEMIGQDGEFRGVTGYASEEARNRAAPGHAVPASRAEATRREGPK
jgi:hypothetical protein